MRKCLILILLLVASYCGEKVPKSGTNTLIFEPSIATIAGGVCFSTAKVIGDSTVNVVLLTSQITLTDSNDENNQVSYTNNDLESIFGTIILPKSSLLEGDLSFNGAENGISGSFIVSYLVIGSGTKGYSVNFAGSLECVE